MDRDVRVVRARRDGEWMPLVLGHRRHLQEQPLARLVLEGRLAELDLDDIWDAVSRPLRVDIKSHLP